MTKAYPQVEDSLISESAQQEVAWLQSFILGIRQIRGEMNIAPSKPLPCFVQNFSEQDAQYLDNNAGVLNTLAKIAQITRLASDEQAPESATALVGDMKILIPLAGLIDKEQEAARLNKEIEKLEKQKAQFEAKLNNEKFVSGAPEAIVNTERERLASVSTQLNELSAQLEKIANL